MTRNLPNSRVYPRPITRCILFSENKTTRNTTDPTESHQRSTGERPSPLSADIVSLVRQASRDICIRPGDAEENAHIAHGVRFGEAHHWESDNAEHGVENQNQASLVVSVTDPGCAEHNDAGEPVWGSDEALRLADAESHAVVQDYGEEVCDGVGDGCQTAVMAGYSLGYTKVVVVLTRRSLRMPRSSGREPALRTVSRRKALRRHRIDLG